MFVVSCDESELAPSEKLVLVEFARCQTIDKPKKLRSLKASVVYAAGDFAAYKILELERRDNWNLGPDNTLEPRQDKNCSRKL